MSLFAFSLVKMNRKSKMRRLGYGAVFYLQDFRDCVPIGGVGVWSGGGLCPPLFLFLSYSHFFTKLSDLDIE